MPGPRKRKSAAARTASLARKRRELAYLSPAVSYQGSSVTSSVSRPPPRRRRSPKGSTRRS